MLTAFGKFCRTLRINQGMLLKDLADLLNVTSAYLSAVEVGKKNVPEKWEARISNIFNLDQEGRKELKRAIDTSSKVVKVNLNDANEQQRELAVVFARKLNDLDKTDLNNIFEIINKKGSSCSWMQ